ncbi:hypothetical protein KC622_03005 [Candidatus Dojkabacteria bacterium]|uniref:Uncharacterized protein n=1 Tax=Candidatus Dojkabacteria bacterium TaxID=2099670 RepID=A0A955KVM6_9BACT|nr:hypothetical protein [Candidatus Dojkabacteria bacterium]
MPPDEERLQGLLSGPLIPENFDDEEKLTILKDWLLEQVDSDYSIVGNRDLLKFLSALLPDVSEVST